MTLSDDIMTWLATLSFTPTVDAIINKKKSTETLYKYAIAVEELKADSQIVTIGQVRGVTQSCKLYVRCASEAERDAYVAVIKAAIPTKSLGLAAKTWTLKEEDNHDHSGNMSDSVLKIEQYNLES